MAEVFRCSVPTFELYKAGKQIIPEYRWDYFEAKYQIRREWMQTGRGDREKKSSNDILRELGEEMKFLKKLKTQKLADRLAKIPDDLPPKKLKILHDFLDLYLEKIE
ncbi:hypothetical protein [Leptospira stimsonii]|nr:hypothetical protein [Leptospira stimsonii]